MVTRLAKRLRSQRGISLVEIIVAALILAIVAVALVEFYHWGRARIMEVGLRRSALAAAEGKMEELRSLYFTHGDMANGDHGPENVQVAENVTGSLNWSVTTYTDFKEIDVTVSWSWEHIDSDHVTLTGLFYR